MYQIGSFIIYGNVGVCRVENITTLDFDDVDKTRLYYVLMPLYQYSTIYIPVENPKVFMRPVIGKEEAEKLIDKIPTVHVEAYHNRSMQLLTAHYEEALRSHDCADLMEMTMSISSKKEYMAQKKRAVGSVEEKFMRRAEELLYGEFAIALDIPKNQVPLYIASRVDAMQQ